MRRSLSRIAAILAPILVLGVLLASPASAHHNTVTGVAVCADDGGYTVTWSIQNSENIGGTAGVSVSAGTLPDSSSTITLPPNRGTVQVTTTHSQAETATLTVDAIWTNTVQNVSTGTVSKKSFPECEESEEYTPPAPGFEEECEVGGYIVIVANDTVDYTVPAFGGLILAPGDHLLPPGEVVTIVAVLKPGVEGVVLTGQTEWTFTGTEVSDCDEDPDEVTPLTPTLVNECGLWPHILLPSEYGVEWYVNGELQTMAEFNNLGVALSNVEVEARPANGFIFPDNATTVWNFDLPAEEPCEPSGPVCPTNYFVDQKMWEVTWGRQFSDTNGVPTFTMESFGGLISLNGGAVPQYMLDYGDGNDWRWLYVNDPVINRVVTYGFADGTVITATIMANDDGCPDIVWETIPPQPEPEVEKGEWTDGNWECDDTTVVQTRTVTTTPYKWNGEEWVLDTENATSETESRTRDLTDEEQTECPPPPVDCRMTNTCPPPPPPPPPPVNECPTVPGNQSSKDECPPEEVDETVEPTPPVTEPPASEEPPATTPPPSAPPSLPVTGAGVLPAILMGLGLISVGGLSIYGSKRR